MTLNPKKYVTRYPGGTKRQDGVLDVADNRALVGNRTQHDDDGDGFGDACDARYSTASQA